MKAFISFLLIMLLSFCVSGREGDRLLGTKAPELNVTDWINSPDLKLADAKGKVILIRWWTAPECPYCRATAPALNEFHQTFSKKGLQVIGIYHHKSETALELQKVKASAAEYGFEFPVAVDPEWRTLKKWWLKEDTRRWTSVSFLLDRNGTIRFIHPGGEYVPGDPDYKELKSKIEELLAE